MDCRNVYNVLKNTLPFCKMLLSEIGKLEKKISIISHDCIHPHSSQSKYSTKNVMENIEKVEMNLE